MRKLGVLLIVYLGAACGDDAVDPPTLPEWRSDLPDPEVMGERRGLHPARGIIHLHSPYSHDACDGNPRGDTEIGPIDEDCLADLRAALCTTRMSYAALTDHDDTMADEDFPTLFSMRDGDEAVMNGADQIASRIHCDNGHEVLITIGSENPLMPIMLDHHVAGTVDERHAIYNGDDAATVTAMRDAGAVVWIPHTEQRTSAELVPLAPDGIEVYQLHANIDPDIREEFLGLDSSGAITNVIAFADTTNGAEPDLALLSFLSPNTPALTVWDELLAQGLRVSGSGGTDAHQNALPILLGDGERGDSYRRMIRWFSNVALVADPTDPIDIEAAIRAGRIFTVFELMGTPDGFDVRAEAGSAVTELGGEVSATAGATLFVDVPTVLDLDPTLPVPEVSAKIIRVTDAGASVVAEGDGDLSVALDTAGAYRVEVSIRPLHLGPYLGNLGTAYAEQTLPWIYASPVYVTP